MDLEDGAPTCFDRDMSTILIELRPAKTADASAVAATHDEVLAFGLSGHHPRRGAGKADQPARPALVGQRDPQGQSHQRSGVRRKGCRLCQLRPQPCPQPAVRWRNLRALPAPRIPGLRLRPAAVHRGPARFDTERAEKHGDLGAVRQRAGDGILSRARRPHGRPLLREVRAEVARQDGVRLDQSEARSLIVFIQLSVSSGHCRSNNGIAYARLCITASLALASANNGIACARLCPCTCQSFFGRFFSKIDRYAGQAQRMTTMC